VTIIGAVSSKMKIIFHHVTYSTNTETVENFFKKFDKKFDLFDKVIVMDNHSAHKSNDVTEFLESKGAIVEFLPPNSSYFNPIETVWSWVKCKWRNTLLQLQDLKVSHTDWMQTELSTICKSCPELVIHNIVNSCNGLMKKFLKEYAPESEELQYFENLEKSKIRSS
jgi:transposase